MSLFVQDDWRRSTNLTFNLGVRYELLWPFVEDNGTWSTSTPRRTSPPPRRCCPAAPVPSPAPSPTRWCTPTPTTSRRASGSPGGLAPGTVLRGGYGISFNSGSYSAIARQMVEPAAVRRHEHEHRHVRSSARRSAIRSHAAQPTETTNNYGVDKNYELGLVQTWNADVSRDLRQVWNVGAGYTHTRGSSLDIVRAPNRGPTVCGSRACSRSSGRRPKAHRGCTPRRSAARAVRCAASAAASPTRSRDRATTRRRSAAAERSSRRTIRTSTPSGGSRASIAATS